MPELGAACLRAGAPCATVIPAKAGIQGWGAPARQAAESPLRHGVVAAGAEGATETTTLQTLRLTYKKKARGEDTPLPKSTPTGDRQRHRSEEGIRLDHGTYWKDQLVHPRLTQFLNLVMLALSHNRCHAR